MWYSKFLWLWFGLGVDELGALLGFYCLDSLVWEWFRAGFPMGFLVHVLWFGDVHVFFSPMGLMFMFFYYGFSLWFWVWCCCWVYLLDLRRTLKNKFLRSSQKNNESKNDNNNNNNKLDLKLVSKKNRFKVCFLI